jgi:hypothetical protein
MMRLMTVSQRRSSSGTFTIPTNLSKAPFFLSKVRFNHATVNRLKTFLLGNPNANDLALIDCDFVDGESFELLKTFLATNNEYPWRFSHSRRCQKKVQSMGILLPAFCTNNTVEMLQVGNIHDPDNMSMVNALLQENHNMKRLYLWHDDYHPGVPFVGSIRTGLVASRGNLQDLTFINGVNGDDGLNGNTGLQDVLSIYTTSNDDVDDCHSTYDVNNHFDLLETLRLSENGRFE